MMIRLLKVLVRCVIHRAFERHGSIFAGNMSWRLAAGKAGRGFLEAQVASSMSVNSALL